MESGQSDILLISFGVIALVIVMTPVVFYVLVRRWQKQIQQDLKNLRSDLRQFYALRNDLERQARTYTPDDPEPFGSQAAKLQEQLAGINQAAGEVERAHVNAQERSHRLASSRWSKTVGKPYGWYSLSQSVLGERQDLKSLRSRLGETESQIQAIARLSWEAAQQAREAREAERLAARKLDELRGKKLAGAALKNAATQLEGLRTTLDGLPALLFEGDETAVIAGVDKNAAAAAFETLQNVRPELTHLLEQLKGWEKDQIVAEGKVAAMRQALAGAEQAFVDAPSALNLSGMRSEFDELQAAANTQSASLARMEVDGLGKVAEDSVRIQRAAQTLDGQVKAARGQLGQLETILTELADGLKSISTRFAALGARETYPIAWGQSRVRFTQISRQSSSLGPAAKPRTLEALEGDLRNAVRLKEQYQELVLHADTLARQHAELLQLFEGSLGEADRWRQGTRKLLEGLQIYDPENWPKADNVQALPEELKALADGLNLLVTGSPQEGIGEDEIGERLENARELAKFYERLRGRGEHATARLQEIQDTEQKAQDQLETARNTFNQATLVVRSNPFLADSAAQEASRLQGVLQSALDEFDHRDTGSVDKKAKHISAVVARVETALNTWVETLTKDIQAQMDELGKGLGELEEAIILDEPAVAEARRLLAAGQPYRSGGKPHFRLDAIVLELKQRSDYWHSCESTLRELEEIVGPVMESYEAASASRKEAKEQFEEILSWMRSTRAWPPVATSLDGDRQEFERVEAQWMALRQQRSKAINLVSQLTSLSAKYQSVLAKARQSAAQAAREQEAIEKIEKELDELVEMWQNQWRAHQDNSMVTEEIRRLLDEMDAEIDSLHQQYRRGSRRYDQILQSMQALKRKARIHQAPIDDSHVVDINGRVIPFG